jgi:hypothetical protein
MDIHGSPPGPERARRAYEQRERALIDANRSLVRSAREDLASAAKERLTEVRAAQAESAARRDELRLSTVADAASTSEPAEREARVRDLAEAYRAERLNTPERIERAAQRLLGG